MLIAARHAVIGFAFSLISGATSQAQNTPAPADATPTIRAQARLVVLDVVVTDKRGAAIHDLKSSDFLVTESGAAQTVKTFEEHRGLGPAEQAKFAEMPTLPPGTFTNITPAPVNGTLNVLLVDTLNTAAVDQVYVRAQILKYLKTAKPGSTTAVFGLASRLYMLQGFTTDRESLRAAMDKSRNRQSALLEDSAGLGNNPEPISSQIAANGSGLVTGSYVSDLQDFEADDAAFKVQLRAQYTLNAMSVLARFMAGLPGRKNLIWFSGSFPINLLPSIDSAAGLNPGASFSGSASFQKQFLETTNLLARGRVAVYPVDAQGLTTPSYNSAAQGGGKSMNPDTSAPSQVQNQRDFSFTTYDAHKTMEQMAQDTGGHAFINSNNLTEAVSSVIEQGGNYYTMAYTPTNTQASGDYRKIEVKLSSAAAGDGYKLAYRRGYFAEKPESRDSALAPGATHLDDVLLRGSLAHGMPNASQVIYKVQVLPRSSGEENRLAAGNITSVPGFADAKPPYRTFTVDFAAPARQTVFGPGKNGLHHASVQFITLVYTADGKVVTMASNKVDADLDDARLATFQHTALTMHQEISVPVKGEYSIRTAIYDQVGSRLGSTEVPVAAIKGLPPAAPTAVNRP